MLIDTKWIVRTTAGEVSSSDARDTFAVTTATDYVSRPFDLRGVGFADGGGELFLHVNRSGTYTKGSLTSLKVTVNTAAAASSTAYNATLTSPVAAISLDIPVATIDASAEICKIPLPPGLKRYIGVTFTNTGAATALGLQARIVTA